MTREVRVRFAPSPTGALHIGGLRTALYNYLFAKKMGGKFLLRIEDTDQTRFVPGAEEYIQESLDWLGISPDESPWKPGSVAPYRQSERKASYMQYALELIEKGHAYYAFDTAEELEAMRERLTAARVLQPQYNSITRSQMKNSLTLSPAEVKERLASGDPYVIRAKLPLKEEVRLHDLIRGWVMVHSSTLDDKVLMKSDGMPTYHLANVIDDYFAKRDYETNGDYIVNDFKLTPKTYAEDEDFYKMSISKGIAYVHGYRVESQATTDIISARARTTDSQNNTPVYMNFGNYFRSYFFACEK